jgi:hypothetical protein
MNTSHRHNHCVPMLDVLDLPEEETAYMVLPFLTSWDDPEFETIGEALEFYRQLFRVCRYIRI